MVNGLEKNSEVELYVSSLHGHGKVWLQILEPLVVYKDQEVLPTSVVSKISRKVASGMVCRGWKRRQVCRAWARLRKTAAALLPAFMVYLFDDVTK